MEKEDLEKKIKDFISSLSPEQISGLTKDFKEVNSKIKNISVEKLESIKSELASVKEKKQAIRLEMKEHYGLALSFLSKEERDERNKKHFENMSLDESLHKEETRLETALLNQENVIKCLDNGGYILEITDQNGYKYESIPDFRSVDSSEFFFDEDNILEIKSPKFVPEIDFKVFASKGYIFDAIRVTEDSYLIAIAGYSRKEKENNFFAILTLDQLVLSIDYYYSKAKALNKQEAERLTKRNEEYYDKQSEESRRRILFQRGYYKVLPVNIKKKITETEWEALDLQGREELYKPYKKYRGEKLTSKLKEGYMWGSFHRMYQDFIDKTVLFTDKNGTPNENGTYANPIVWKYWADFMEMVDYKLIDIRIQRQDYSETYEQARETSFGNSNTSDVLLDKYGILIKRQNGDPINPIETDLIKNSWIKIQKVFGNLKPEALKHNLKISHSGNKMIFASKFVGVYISSMGTIGVSNKLGENQFESIFSHEVAHFIDNFIGELNGKRYSTDNFEGLAGKIAFTFRNSMNKPKSEQTEYIKSTKECFARCMQQYYGWKTYGDNDTVGISVFSHPDFVPKDKFINVLVPMIEEFFKSNLDVFETTDDLDGTNDLAPITKSEDVKIGLEFYEYYDPIKQRVVSFNEKFVYSIPITEDDNYQFKHIFSLNEFKTILSKQDEFEAEIKNSEQIQNERIENEKIKDKEYLDFKNAVSSFVKGDLEVGKTIKSLDKIHKINGKLDTLKNHIEKFASEVKDYKDVIVRDIDGVPHFSIDKMSFTPLSNRSGEKYFNYLISLKKPKEENIDDIIDALELIGETDLADALRLIR